MASSTTWYTFKYDAYIPEKDELRVVDFVGREKLSQTYHFEIELASPDTNIDFSSLVNKPASLEFLRGGKTYPINGIVSRFEQGARGGAQGWVTYRATLVPRVWRLSLTHQSRIFQEKTVEDIIKDVLAEADLADAARFELTGDYPVREYCVQYNETDLNFISRLMEHEGIFFFFEQTESGEIMVIADDQAAFIDIGGEKKANYYPQGASDYDRVSDFSYREQIVTGKVILKDYNYRTPDTMLESDEQKIDSKMPGLYYAYGDHFKEVGEGNQLAIRRKEEIECTRKVMTGRADNMRFRAGHKFTLAAHYRSDLNIDYLVTGIEYFGGQPVRLEGSQNSHFECIFTVIDAEIPFRPPRLTPVPKIPGIMTARIETAGGDYAFIDDEGRYHTKMHFDRRDLSDGTASRPIRMSQPYSGPDYGIHFPNHANTEMVWACIDGDVDRPLALGTVPNPSQGTPSIDANKYENVIRTWGEHELIFDDTIDTQRIYLHSTKDWVIDITNDKNQKVGNNETLDVVTNRDKTVGKNQSESIGESKTISVGGDHTESITGNESISIEGNESITVSKDQSLNVTGNKSLDVGKDSSSLIGKSASSSIGDNLDVQVGKNADVQIGKKTNFQSGDNIAVSGKKKATITIQDELTIKVGKASITMKKNGDITIKGAKINVKGSGNVAIKGSKVTEN